MNELPTDPTQENEEEKVLQAIIASPVEFCKAVLGFFPFAYQEKFLEDKSKRIVACAGRQVGKSLITAARALWFSISHPETTTLIVSATLRQSSLLFDKILQFVGESSALSSSIFNQTRTKLEFTNGSKIIALPCGPKGDSLRGHTANLIIVDEAAFVPEDVITNVTIPMLATTEGTIMLLSTPFDRNHFFFRAFTSPEWSKYHFKTEDNPLVAKEFLELQRREIGERKFAQEYMAEFVDEESTYFSNTLLRSCIHVCSDTLSCSYCDIIKGSKKPESDLFAGYDPGGMNDPAALVVVERYADSQTKTLSYRVVMMKTFLLQKSEKQDQKIYTTITAQVHDLHKKLGFRRLFVDSTGLGKPIVEHCRELGLPVEGMTFTSQSKENMLSSLRLALEQRKVVLPNNLELLSSLNCITFEPSRSGGYSFGHARGTHDDLAYALALAFWAARNWTKKVIEMRSDDPASQLSWRERMGMPREWGSY